MYVLRKKNWNDLCVHTWLSISGSDFYSIIRQDPKNYNVSKYQNMFTLLFVYIGVLLFNFSMLDAMYDRS
jgi:hypothetical protein